MGLPFRIPSLPGLLILSMVAATLVGIIGLELRAGVPDETAVAPARPDAEILPVSNTDSVPDRQQTERHIAVILARPLFSPSRRPNETSATKAADLARLTGVVVSPAGKSAIFAGPPGGKSVAVGEGVRMGEYFVRSIEVGTVTLIGPGGTRVLHLAFDPSPPKPVTLAPPTPLVPKLLPGKLYEPSAHQPRLRE